MKKKFKRFRAKVRRMSRTFKDLYWSIKSISDPNIKHKLTYWELFVVFTPDWAWNIYYKICNFFVWLFKSFKYAWFLRNDRDWEPSDILRLLDFKLGLVRKNLVGNSYRTEEHDKEMSDLIDEMRRLIKDINEKDYSAEEDAAHENKWGKVLSWTRKEEDANGNVASIFHLDRANVKTQADEDQENKDKRSIWDLEEKRRTADKEKLFALLRDGYEKLWD